MLNSMEKEKVSLHAVLLEKKISEYKAKGSKVIRLDRSYTPDAIIIDWTNRKVVVQLKNSMAQKDYVTQDWDQKQLAKKWQSLYHLQRADVLQKSGITLEQVPLRL